MKKYLYITGHIKLEGSKSILNRVLIITSYLKKSIKVYNPTSCNDIATMIENLYKLGLNFQKSKDFWIVSPPGKLLKESNLYIQDSGTAYRFLIARIAALKKSKSVINISDQLKDRPIKPLIEILCQMDSKVESNGDSLTINGARLKGGTFRLAADISSQFISALLLIAPSYQKDLELFLDGEIVSRSYLEMTIKIMCDFGVIVIFENNRLFIRAGQQYRALSEYNIEPDYSSACYFWTLGALSRSIISTNTIDSKSIQPDYKFLTVLKKIGAKIEVDKNKISVCRGELKGISIDMKNMPDQVPTLVILMLFTSSKTIITNIEHLKYKESNRIEALVSELYRIGVDLSYLNGMLEINPLTRIEETGTLNTYGDHRLVMAFSILKMFFPKINITDTHTVDKSYPNFINDLRSLKH